MTASVIKLPGTKDLPKGTSKSVRSIMDTILLTPAGVDRWKNPPFQRPLRLGGKNSKVRNLIEELKLNGGVIPGILTLGKHSGETYLIDGQHRVAAFKEAGLEEGFVDVRICHFNSVQEMSEEFVQLNSSLVRLTPDDILRAEESSNPAMKHIRKECPFVGYGFLWSNPHSPILSMSSVIRCWMGSRLETPALYGGGRGGTLGVAQSMELEEAQKCVGFLKLAFDSWGKDREYRRLWGSANLVMCMWIYRRMVIEHRPSKVTKMLKSNFGRCLMGLSAAHKYIDWLAGRTASDRDRNATYNRIRQAFTLRAREDGMGRLTFPGAPWYSQGGSSTRELI